MSKKDNNHAILFTNNNKVNSNQPDYKGSFELHGKKGQAAAWIKTAKNNQKYLSISFQDSNPLQESELPHKKINSEKEKIANQGIKDVRMPLLGEDDDEGKREALEALEKEAKRAALENKNLDYAMKQAKDSRESSVELGEGKKTKQTFLKRFLKNQW